MDLRNRIHIKPTQPDDTETMHKLQNKPTLTGFKSYGNYDCVDFKNQTVNY